ncbi:MAG: hypothetical protein AAGF12_27055 [Myxococcota bacterium]
MARASLLLLFLAACGAPAQSAQPSEAPAETPSAGGEDTLYQTIQTEQEPSGGDEGEFSSLFDSMSREFDQLGTMLSAAEVDCDSAAVIAGRICDLADRICAIAEEQPEEEGVRQQCEEGQRRCVEANDAFAEACGSTPLKE